MAVPGDLRARRCLGGVYQLLVHALILGASEGTVEQFVNGGARVPIFIDSMHVYNYNCVGFCLYI